MWKIITFDAVKQVVVLFPMMLIGLFLGMISSKIVEEKMVKKLVSVMLMISGIALVMNSF
jgi:hypothetical protein